MTNTPEEGHVNAWKALIELSKTTISISSAVLTALIGYYVLYQPSLGGSFENYVPIGLLGLSILFAIYGFGRAITAIKSGKSDKRGTLFVNLSVASLFFGIISVAVTRFEQPVSLDGVAAKVAQETKSLRNQLTPNEIVGLKVSGDLYTISYKSDGVRFIVTYSSKDDKIIELK